MKKLMMTALLISASLTTYAKSGDDNLDLRNSMAGFASESVEEAIELFYRTNTGLKDQVLASNFVRNTQDDATVVIELEDGSIYSYNCIRFDDWSRGGTVLKKEVVCRL